MSEFGTDAGSYDEPVYGSGCETLPAASEWVETDYTAAGDSGADGADYTAAADD